MRGEVEVLYIDGTREKSSNLLLDNFGSLIADILTVPRFIAGTNSEAILDTSNYVVQAISFSKDAAGYNRHAHASIYSSLLSDNIIRIVNPNSTSSYESSNIGENIWPDPPKPWDTRLESESTTTTGVPLNSVNPGHNYNIFKENLPSPVYALIGCYPPSSNIDVYILSSIESPNSPIYSATLSGNNFNKEGTMDFQGLVRRTVSSLEQGRSLYDTSTFSGLTMTHDDNWDTTGNYNIKYTVAVSADDQFFTNLYGGIYNMGLWALDLKETLRRGYLPPYDILNDSGLAFKLIAKKSFLKDITIINDGVATAGFEALKARVEAGTLSPGILIFWNIYFK